MMTSRIKQYETQLGEIVNKSLTDTFVNYFKISINKETLKPGSQFDDLVTTQTYIHDVNLSGLIFISIERKMLVQLAAAVFPPDMAVTDPAIESCLTDISNIVCSRIKTYFNEIGYDMVMDIPSVTMRREKRLDNIQILFSVREDKLVVDIGFEDLSNDTNKRTATA